MDLGREGGIDAVWAQGWRLIQSNFPMRIPYPERIPYSWATVVAGALFAIIVWQGTAVEWAICFFCFFMLAVTGVNLGGGMYRPVGAYICFNAVLTLILGVVGKIVLREPADSNLLAPMHLIEVYMVGMASICFAALIDYLFRPRRSLLTRWFPVVSLRKMYIGVLVVGIGMNLYWMSDPVIAPGTFTSALRYTDELLPFGVVLGVMYTVRTSNGKRSMNFLLLFVITLMTLEGLLLYSKQGLFMGTFAWVLGVGLTRFRLKAIHLITLGVLGFLMVHYAVTVVQAGKNLDRGTHPIENIAPTWDMLMRTSELRQQNEPDGIGDRQDVQYYNQEEGLLDRLQMVGIDDLLIAETDRDGFIGYGPMEQGWVSIVPHVIWKDKPNAYYGNYYAHQLDLLADGDDTTGVSFSPSADAYKQGGFFGGIVVMETTCLSIVFLMFSIIAGDVRDHPVAMVLVLSVAHVAPEGAVAGAINQLLFAVAILGIGFFARFVTPILTSAVTPPEKLENGALMSLLD